MKKDRIRWLLPQDSERIERLVEKAGVFSQAEVLVAMELVEEYLKHGEQGDYKILCAEDNHKNVTGYICFGLVPMTDKCWDLYWIVVDHDCSRKGVGGELLRDMEDYARRKGGRRIYAETSSTPLYLPARSFYLRHGYYLDCLMRDFYRVGDNKMIFCKEL
jgi:GNAT superfamily N-acetyltransferase